MLITIKNNVLGTIKKNVVYDSFENKLETTTQQTGWIYDNSIKPNIQNCFDSLLKLNSKEIHINIKEEYRKMAADLHLDLKSDIKWKYLMKKDDYLEYSKSILRQIMFAAKDIDQNYYKKFHKRFDTLFASLLPAKINEEKFTDHQQNETQPALMSFQPNSKGYAKPILYDRFGTSTGRLIVESGPQILTLKKELRDVMQSRFDGGKLFYIDFKALEATILLSLLGVDVHEDPYEYIMKILDLSDRATAKKSFMAYFYGEEKYLNNVFNKQVLIDKLSAYRTGNILRNFFGRKIKIDDENKLISYFVQSSGVDISLLGFTKIVEEIEKKNYMIAPLFLIHDGFVVDVAPKDFDKLELLGKIGAEIEEFPAKFMLKIDEI